MKHSFELSPTIRYNRSMFDLSHNVKTTMSLGKLYPVDWQEVLPGDTFKVQAPFVARCSSTFIKPIIDNLFIDVYSFFVPYRLLDDKYAEVFGVAKPSAYQQNLRKSVPSITGGVVGSATVADYLGLPVGKEILNFSNIQAYPFRAFALIYNHYFRNENIIDETYVYTDNNEHVQENLNSNPWSNSNYTGLLPNVAKKKDYFTTCLPQPQKGEAVTIPMAGTAPLTVNIPSQVVNFMSSEGGTVYPFIGQPMSGRMDALWRYNGSQPDDTQQVNAYTEGTAGTGGVDLTQATAASINDWRYAFALQRMLEKDARFGTRYSEYVYGHFGVSFPDVYSFPEYLGGGRTPVNMQEVAQTSQSTEASPLASLSGYSLTNGFTRYTKSFKEHGIVMTVACIRQIHSYEQGVAKKWMRRTREDFYDPTFANIGEQPVYASELYNGDSLDGKNTIFGYNEAWCEYRYCPNTITGQLRSAQTGGKVSLDMWTLGDFYSSRPYLSKAFIEENGNNIDRVLSVETDVLDNFIFDFYFKISAVRVMPTYSNPGLIDHG